MTTISTTHHASVPPNSTRPSHSPAPSPAAATKAVNADLATGAPEHSPVSFDGLDTQPGELALDDLPQDAVRSTSHDTDIAPARLQRIDEVKLDVPNASGIASLGDGQFIVVDDEKGIYLAKENGKSKKLVSSKHDHALTDLEGVCLTPDGQGILSISERSGTVTHYDLKHKHKGKIKLGDGEILGQLPKIQRVHNKGWEGLTVLPGRFCSDGQPRLLAVNERSPRRLGVFSYPGLQQQSLLKLPKNAKKFLSDMSDIAVCPQTGRVFVLSDESKSLVEFRMNLRQQNAPGALLDASDLQMISHHQLDFKRNEKTEGLSFDGAGRLYVATDQRNRLAAYDVTRDNSQ